MLKQGRIDAYMDNGDGLQAYAHAQGLFAPSFEIHEVFRKGLYFGFANTREGRKLKTIFDNEIDKLIANHHLDKIYRDAVKNGPELTHWRCERWITDFWGWSSIQAKTVCIFEP